LDPDVVIMDVDLPDLSGIEATRQIAAERPHIRVIGVSMYDFEEVAKAMFAAGAAAHLPKNAPAAEVIAKIRTVQTRA
jgi:DNA-binding NarL/FixJ family response regulator